MRSQNPRVDGKVTPSLYVPAIVMSTAPRRTTRKCLTSRPGWRRVAAMATSFDPAATPKPVETGILEQVDLIACALTEKVRRRQVRDNIGVGAWAVVTDPKLVEQLGEEIVRERVIPRIVRPLAQAIASR